MFVLSLLNISATPPYRVRNVGDVQFEADERNYRLPNNTKPEAYVVYISTDVAVGKFEFYGSVKIAIRVLQNTNNITLHQRQLKILAAQLMAEGGRNIPTFTPHFDSNTEFLTISTVNETLQNGSKVVLKLKYQGNLRKDAAGFYRSSYINAEGKRVYEFIIFAFHIGKKTKRTLSVISFHQLARHYSIRINRCSARIPVL